MKLSDLMAKPDRFQDGADVFQSIMGEEEKEAAQRKKEPSLLESGAKITGIGALTGAGVKGLASGYKALKPGVRGVNVGREVAKGGLLGAGAGAGLTGLIALGRALHEADPSGRSLEAVVQLAPAAVALGGAVMETDTKEKTAVPSYRLVKRGAMSRATKTVLTGAGGGAALLAAKRGLTYKKQKQQLQDELEAAKALHHAGVVKDKDLSKAKKHVEQARWAREHKPASMALAAGVGAGFGAATGTLAANRKRIYKWLTKAK